MVQPPSVELARSISVCHFWLLNEGKNEIELTARVWREVLDRAWGGVASEELGEEMGKNRK